MIKPCCLGDVLLATATVRVLAEARPDLRLDFVVGEWSRPALEGNPHLVRLVPTSTNGSGLSGRAYLALVGRLRQENYAAALVLDRSPRLTLLPWLAGIPLRAGLDNRGRGFALNLRATQPSGVRHEAEVYLDVARVLGLVPVAPHLEYSPPPAARKSLEQKAAALGLNLARPLVVIHPGGGQNPDTQVLSKRWPAQRFGEIAARLARQGLPVVVIGAASDRAVVDGLLEVAAVALAVAPDDLAPPVLDACGEFDLAESGALLSRATLFVGNDTGVMHLAVACGAAVVAIFGPSSPLAYGPYSSRSRAVAPVLPGVAAGLPLKEYQSLSVAQGGIEAVTVEAVWQAVVEVGGGAVSH